MIRLALKNLWRQPLRSGLTITGVVCGVGAVVAMLSIEGGTQREVLTRIRAMGLQHIILNSVAPAGLMDRPLVQYGLTEDDLVHFTEHFEGLQAVGGWWRVAYPVSYRGQSHPVQAYGLTPGWLASARIPVLKGRSLSVKDGQALHAVAVVTRPAADLLRLPADLEGVELRVGRFWVRVVGVVGGDESAVYLPLATVRTAFGPARLRDDGQASQREVVGFDRIVIRLERQEDVAPTAERLRAYLAAKGRVKEVELVEPLKMLEHERSIQEAFRLAMGAIAGIALLVGGIGIMNIMMATVSERTREIGTRRALGATRAMVLRQFLTEAVVLTMVGACLGLVFGVGVAQGAAGVMSRPVVYSPWSFAVPFLAALLVGGISGWYPAYRAARMDPLQALRVE